MTPSPSILIDTTRCDGCEECVAACKAENGLGRDRPLPGRAAVDALSSTRYSTILRRPGGRFVRQQCRHCLEPACASACPVGALRKSPEGPVVYDATLCIGCRYCMVACPWGIPRYDWGEPVPYVRKCTLCHHRILEGRRPACVEACPREALLFGSRDDVLAEAHRRIEAEPGRYLPAVEGEREAGGTSVLYLSDVDLGFLERGWEGGVGPTPLPELTWASLKKVPTVVLLMGGLMAGFHWTVRRRNGIAAARAAAGGAKGPAEGGEDGHA